MRVHDDFNPKAFGPRHVLQRELFGLWKLFYLRFDSLHKHGFEIVVIMLCIGLQKPRTRVPAFMRVPAAPLMPAA